MPTVHLSEYDYPLPADSVAAEPLPQRDASRLLVLPRRGGALRHLVFTDLLSLLGPGDLLVANDSRVLPARLIGKRKDSGGAVELLLLEPVQSPGRWTCLAAPGRKAPPGAALDFGGGLTGTVVDRASDGGRVVEFETAGEFLPALERVGLVPLPPYVLARRAVLAAQGGAAAAPVTGRSARGKPALHAEADRERYQTVYARVPGSVAGPTAGLHFTHALLDALLARGVGWATVTLHVGLATFRPIRAEDVESHRMLEERFEIADATREAMARCRAGGGRVIAVGTTTARALEADASGRFRVEAGAARTDLFIRPPFEFRALDGLITNFHLPRSTLLLLVSALASREAVLAAYAEAASRGYRFYSYGDAMAIL